VKYFPNFDVIVSRRFAVVVAFVVVVVVDTFPIPPVALIKYRWSVRFQFCKVQSRSENGGTPGGKMWPRTEMFWWQKVWGDLCR